MLNRRLHYRRKKGYTNNNHTTDEIIDIRFKYDGTNNYNYNNNDRNCHKLYTTPSAVRNNNNNNYNNDSNTYMMHYSTTVLKYYTICIVSIIKQILFHCTCNNVFWTSSSHNYYYYYYYLFQKNNSISSIRIKFVIITSSIFVLLLLLLILIIVPLVCTSTCTGNDTNLHHPICTPICTVITNWIDQYQLDTYSKQLLRKQRQRQQQAEHNTVRGNINMKQNNQYYFPNVVIHYRGNRKDSIGYNVYLMELLSYHQISNRRRNSVSSINYNNSTTTSNNNRIDNNNNNNKFIPQSTVPIVSSNFWNNNNNKTTTTTTTINITTNSGICKLRTWYCNRCLHSPYYGTIHKCAFLCCSTSTVTCGISISIGSTEYYDQVYSITSISSYDTTNSNIIDNPKQQQRQYLQQQQQQCIPLIIYQGWYTSINSLQYPELYRIQLSWKAQAKAVSDPAPVHASSNNSQQYRIKRRLHGQYKFYSYDTIISTTTTNNDNEILFANSTKTKTTTTTNHQSTTTKEQVYNTKNEQKQTTTTQEEIFIQQHYPLLYLNVYKKLKTTEQSIYNYNRNNNNDSHNNNNTTGGRFFIQSDEFLRLLLLYHTGGIWANIDFLPETSIQSFLKEESSTGQQQPQQQQQLQQNNNKNTEGFARQQQQQQQQYHGKDESSSSTSTSTNIDDYSNGLNGVSFIIGRSDDRSITEDSYSNNMIKRILGASSTTSSIHLQPKLESVSLLHHCIWNGFIASEGQHPILERAIEIIMTIAVQYFQLDDDTSRTSSTFGHGSNNKNNYYDWYEHLETIILSMHHNTIIRRDTITTSTNNISFGDVEIWKLRVLRHLYSNKQRQPQHPFQDDVNGNGVGFGCLLGMIINHILQSPSPVSDLTLGRQPIPVQYKGTLSVTDRKDEKQKDWGDISILLMSQDDTGAYRCTDIENNRLIGTTAMIGMKDRLVGQFQRARRL